MANGPLDRAVSLARKVGYVIVASADASGQPHVATAGRLGISPEGLVAVSAWFCPGTVANLQHNRRVTVVAWDPATDEGYQLVGRVRRVEELAVMDGYLPEIGPPLPQVERQLLVEVEEILRFSRGPHSDVAEEDFARSRA